MHTFLGGEEKYVVAAPRNCKPAAGGKEKWVVAAPRNYKPLAGGKEKYVAATAAKLQALASKVKGEMRPLRNGRLEFT